MSIRTFTRLHAWICLMILLASAAALPSVQRVSAAEQKVILSAEQVKQAMWGANWNESTPLKSIKLEGLIRSYLMTNVGLHGPNDQDVIELERRYIEQLGPRGADPDYRNNLPYDQVTRAMFDAANSMPVFEAVAVKVWIDLLHSSEAPVVDSLITYSFEDTVARYQSVVQQAALDRAEQDPQFADNFDKVFKPQLGVSIKDFDPQTFLASHPNFPIAQQLRDGINRDGSVALSLKDLEDFAKTEYGKVDTSIDDLQLTLVKLDMQQGQLVDYMKNQQARQAAEALAKAKAQEHQLKLQAADTSIFIIATLAGFINPKVGNQIATVGRSALQIGESLNGWLTAVAGLNTLDKLSSLSTVVMTGNVLSAVMNVVSLFGDAQPTPDQMILEEIGKLRQQVDQLRSEMHDRFDRVDQELNTIYTTMHDRFDQIDLQLGKITGSLQDLQQSLIAISLDLSRMERNNFEFLDALGRRPLRDAINGAIGYRKRTGVDMPYQPDFVGYENTFQTWGTVDAFDALSAGPSQRDYSDGQVLAELSAAPLDANLNYLNGWLSAHGLAAFSSKRLASPRDWTFASRAYADIGFDWPAHLRRIDPQRQAALDAVGNDLELALENISTIQTAKGPQGNTPLFNGVIAYYNAKLAALDTSIQSSENGFIQELRANRLQRAESFDLFGGIDQPLAYQPADLGSMSCGGTAGTLATPSNLKNIIPSYNRVTLSDYMRLSTVTVCVTGQWVDEFEDCVVFPGDQLPTCTTIAFPQATITVYSNNVALASRSYVPGIGFNISGQQPIDWIMDNWATTYKPQFQAQLATLTPESNGGVSPTAANQIAALAGDLQTRLAGYQQELYGRVVTGLNNGAQHPAAVELAGAKKLLASFITLGFPQAVDSDDFMRSLLFSDQQLPDDQQVITTYAASLTPAGSAAALTSNPRLTLLAAAQKRREALASLTTRYLDRISAKTYSEDSSMIANTRLNLRLARIVASTASASAPGRSVFLPLAAR